MDGARDVARPDSAARDRLAPSPLARVFEHAGSLVRLARHQQLQLGTGMDDCSYLVHSGSAALEAAVPGRHIVGFWQAGDLLEASHMPAFPHLALRALEDSDLWRLRQASRKPLFAELPDVLSAYQRLSARTVKRLMIATVMLGRLTAEARVASFLLYAARARPHANRAMLAMPISRTDIADHLGLNPDTLSRIMRRLRSEGIIATRGRHSLTIRDWAALAARSPIPPDLAD